ncbi:MAG: mechanosensitive ion channel family protein [Acidobacteriota bacterium]
MGIVLLTTVSIMSLPAADQKKPGEPQQAASADENRQVSPDSPRACLRRYLDLCREGRYEEAAGYLDIPEGSRSEGPRLARRLKIILDHATWLDLDLVSPLAEGNTRDGLPRGTEKIGSIETTGGGSAPVLLVRRDAHAAGRWILSRGTVNSIDDWFGQIESGWLLEHLPRPLLRPGPWNLLWWQCLALPLLALVAWGLGWGLSSLSQKLFGRVAARTKTEWDDVLLARIGGPLTMAWTIIVLRIAIPWLDLSPPPERFIQQTLRTFFFVAFFWAALRTVDIASRMVSRVPWVRDRAVAKSLLPIATRVTKILLAAMAAIAVISDLGYPVASLIAGMGLGGFAFALAAQKTLENLFGSVSIGVDAPLREGDFVRIEDFVGTVETIGLRSTRIRTLDRTLITLPNGRLADMRIETFAARDRIRLSCTLGVTYDTTAAQMREILDGVEKTLREHPKIWPDAVIVRFASFGDSSLNIDVMAWFMTTDYGEFLSCRQEVLLGFMDVVEKAGSSFAFPTRTVHLIRQDA